MLAPIDVRPSGTLAAAAPQIALDLAHPVHDCIYLALATTEGVPMVTAGRRPAAKTGGRGSLPPAIWVGSAASRPARQNACLLHRNLR
jgi:hypothetical protein